MDKDFGKFEQHTKGIGLKLMQKMGYRVGEGLGASGEGIVKPIETKQRPGKLGLAYGGFKEKRQDEKKIEDSAIQNAAKKPKKPKKNAWKKTAKPEKPTVEYKTAEEIIKEVGEAPTVQPMKIIDMTGPKVREISSASQITSLVIPDTSDRLPELRHNLRLIVDMSKADLEHFTRELRLQSQRSKTLENDRSRVTALFDEETKRFQRLNEVMTIIKECKSLLASIISEEVPSLNEFLEPFEKLQTEYSEEYLEHDLDAAVVALITPVIKKNLVDWDPLDDPTLVLSSLQRWQRLLKTNPPILIRHDLSLDSQRNPGNVSMTPYESMMYNVWLPKIRSAINNSWDARNFDPAINLVENWKPPLLPVFIYDNILEQLIMPKLSREVDSWNPKTDTEKIHLWLHPWMPVLRERMDPLYAVIRRKFGVALQAWHPSDSSAFTILRPWKEVFQPVDMQALLVKSILPKLAQTLRTEFNVNPRKQNLDPFNWVIKWQVMFSPVTLGRLFETEFFPMWLDTLYTWLTHNPNYDEVVEWYQFWKSQFPPEMAVTPAIETGFKQGLGMMNEGMSLGEESATKLSHPLQSHLSDEEPVDELDNLADLSIMPEIITFREIIEEFAQEHNHLFLPANKTHEASGRPLFRFGGTTGGVGGVLLYMKDDVMYVQEGKDWMPMDFNEVLEKVEGSSGAKG